MKITKISKKDNMDEMKEWFQKRTKKHIGVVQKYCKKIADYDKKYEELIERGKVHDQSKFKDPEIDPYIYITWQYKCKDDGIDWSPPDGLDEKMSKATEHHVKSNRHHPEYHSKKEVDLINRSDRDKPPSELIDATNMKAIDIAEMVADWVSMGVEKGNSAISWADKNVNVRWKFTDEQKDLIYELITVCEE